MLALGRDLQPTMIGWIIVYQIIQRDTKDISDGLASFDIWKRFPRLP